MRTLAEGDRAEAVVDELHPRGGELRRDRIEVGFSTDGDPLPVTSSSVCASLGFADGSHAVLIFAASYCCVCFIAFSWQRWRLSSSRSPWISHFGRRDVLSTSGRENAWHNVPKSRIQPFGCRPW